MKIDLVPPCGEYTDFANAAPGIAQRDSAQPWAAARFDAETHPGKRDFSLRCSVAPFGCYRGEREK